MWTRQLSSMLLLILVCLAAASTAAAPSVAKADVDPGQVLGIKGACGGVAAQILLPQPAVCQRLQHSTNVLGVQLQANSEARLQTGERQRTLLVCLASHELVGTI